MKDEIKEILDYLNKFINDKEEITKYGCEISVKQAKQLLDYITNLQKENERLKENAIHNDKVVDKAKWNEMIYKSRNEKAIKKLKEEISYLMPYEIYKDEVEQIGNKVTNILEGSDKE